MANIVLTSVSAMARSFGLPVGVMKSGSASMAAFATRTDSMTAPEAFADRTTAAPIADRAATVSGFCAGDWVARALTCFAVFIYRYLLRFVEPVLARRLIIAHLFST